MTLPGIEPRSPGPLANTLPTRPMSQLKNRHYTYTYTNICGNIIKNHDDFNNEQIHFFTKKTLFSKGLMSVVCEKWVETETDCYNDPSSSLGHSNTFSASWLGCSTEGHWEPKALSLQAGSHSGIPVSPALDATGTCLYLFLMPTCFRLFTQVHLLIDGSVEGQYITLAWQLDGQP